MIFNYTYMFRYVCAIFMEFIHQLKNLLIHNRLYQFEVHEDSTEVPKHVGAVKYHTFKRVCNFLTTARYVTGQK
jgi:hypothetical protein